MDVDRAYELIERAVRAGRVANAYLLVGGVRGMAGELAERVLHLLFGAGDLRVHPDIHRLMPEKKTRIISVEAMRERMIEPMEKTTFMGGWKAGVVLGADRLRTESANAFLKTLEEPPPKTLFLLLTDQPDAILPTIASRSQRIDLPLSDGVLEGEAYDAVAEIFECCGLSGIYEKAQAGKRLAEILSELKDEAEDEDVALVRKSFYKTVMSFVRGWMTEGLLPNHQAFRNVAAVEDAFRQSERYIPEESVLCFLADRLVWPPRD